MNAMRWHFGKFLIQSALSSAILAGPSFSMAQQAGNTAAATDMSQTKSLQLLWLSNVHRDPGEQGHGEGYELYVLFQGEVSTGGIMEFEGSQVDPAPTCLVGELKQDRLSLHGSASPERMIEVNGRLVRGHPAQTLAQKRLGQTNSGYVFRGTVHGGIFESLGPVVLRQDFGDQTPDDVQSELQDTSCACEWNQSLGEKSFTKDQCRKAPEPQSTPK